MAITTTKARQLCTKPELELFRASLAKNVGSITPGRLKQKIQRARKLRDKYRKLAQQQEREARGKGEKRRTRASHGSGNTRVKEQIFQETLERLEAQANKLAASEKKAGNRQATPKKTPGKKSVVRKKKSPTRKAPAKAKATPAASTRKKAATKKTSEAGRTRKKKARPKTRVSKTPVKTDRAAKRRAMTSSGRVRQRTHVSARGRRSQARRDSRR